jgi:pimeloyl-ACP methyl ester carboxylesterase
MVTHKVRGWPQFAKPPAVNKIDSISVPTLILAGDKDMRYILDAAEILDQRIPKSRRIIIPGVAHMMNLEKPDQFNRAVESFLQSKS